MRRAPIITQVDDVPPPIVERPKPTPSAMWLILKELSAGKSLLVNRSANYIRGLISELAGRETDPEAQKEMRRRRYKVKQVDEDNTRVWRLK